MAVFTCKLCGSTHDGLPPPQVETDDSEVAKRRAAWLAADEKFGKSPTNEHLERSFRDAWFSYGKTMPPTTERLPETMTTKLGADGYFFVCTTCAAA